MGSPLHLGRIRTGRRWGQRGKTARAPASRTTGRYSAGIALFLDRHDAPGAQAAQIAAAHELDVAVQDKYGVRYVTYWFDETGGTVFCLAEGPDRESVETVHREAHGLMADNVIEVGEGPINAFLGPLPQHPLGTAYVEPAVRAILFTDLCGSTAQTAALGDEGHVAVLHEHNRIVRTALGEHKGREVKHTGDGIMASFSSVVSAVECAIAIQSALKERNSEAEVPCVVRIGIAAGEPVTDDGDLFGAAVQLSARLCAEAAPDGIAVSTAVRELCVGKRLSFQLRGTQELKGFQEAVPIYEVLWEH